VGGADMGVGAVGEPELKVQARIIKIVIVKPSARFLFMVAFLFI
jgi:hypothetical protein